ncbi:MAG: hypothetical protein IID07_15830 [Gemmatimonadetes bacterium]|nr:hypothetical protein [Gemmatimonadota bacterium]
MRSEVDAARVREFMRELGRSTSESARVYLVGGGTAVLHGWREMTADLDIKFVSEVDLGPVLSDLKQRLNLNIELASPDLFIPPLPGWEERSQFIQREGKLDFFHFDLYSQALSKIERGFDRDLDDVAAMIETGGVDRARLLELFLAIKPELNRYPALDPSTFEQAVRRIADAE